MTATFFGEKNTFRGELFCSTAFRADFVGGLIACIFFYIRLRVKRDPVKPVEHVQSIEAILAYDCLDIAIVASGPESQFLEHIHRRRMLALYIANEHISTNQPIESKHWFALSKGETMCTPDSKRLSFRLLELRAASVEVLGDMAHLHRLAADERRRNRTFSNLR
jgi:hypothetical protein